MIFITRTNLDGKLLKDAFEKVRAEFEDHLHAINENTNEISVLFDTIFSLESKIMKLNEKLDEIQMNLTDGKFSKERFRNIILTPREREVFLILYTKDGDLIGYREIARLLGFTEEMVHRYVEMLISKGIPIVKRYRNSEICLALDSEFRTMQAKENLIKVNETLSTYV